MDQLAVASLLFVAIVAGCSSDDAQPQSSADAGKDVAVVGDTAGLKNDGEPPKDLSKIPRPGTLADAVGREPPPGPTDLPLDVSCMGTPMPIKTGEPIDRTPTTSELGDTSSLVPEVGVEIFYSNTPEGTPDVTGTSAMTTAELKAKIPPGFFLVKTKKAGFIDTVAYDWWPEIVPLSFAIANPDKLTGLQVLIGGPDYMHRAGSSRLVARVKDCKQHDIANAHVVIEIGGSVVAPVTTGDGIRRNYFSDNELPSKATSTSRSGVAAFLNVPVGIPVRLIAYGKSGGAIVPIGIRSLKPVADAVVTAYITPWLEP